MGQEENTFMDPLIDEVRERRRRLLAEHGNDIEKLYETIRMLQSEHPQKVKDRRRAARPGRHER